MLRRVFVVMAGVLVLAGVGAGSAFGAFSYPFDGQLAPAAGSFGSLEPGSVAVDDSNGSTYVADSAAGVVDVFETSSGAQVGELTGTPTTGTPAGTFGGRQVAVAASNATGDVYVLDSTDNVVDVFSPAGAYVCQITGSSTPSASECNGVAGSDTPAHGFSTPGGIAVDQATGEVYVVDANNSVVDIFSVAGAYVRQISLASIPGGFSSFYTRGVAVDDFNGDVYVADSGPEVVYVFNALSEWVTTWTGTPSGHFSGFVSVAADNASGDVYVTESFHQATDVFDSSGSYLRQFGHSFNSPLGTAIDQASGRIDVSDNNPAVVDIFDPAVVIPDVTTGAASSVLPTGATLNGTVNPDGIQLSDCHFEYGADSSYGQSAPCVPAAGAIPADSSEHAVSATLTGLVAGTTYHFRLASANANGPNTGADATFSTPPPPSVENASAVNVASSSADLTAKVDPNGYGTTYRFEWGTSAAYGTSVPVPDRDVGAGTSGVPVATHLSGLSADTTYHWRVVAQSANGTTTTADHTFIYSTAGGGLPDGRAYEMVTPVQKNAALPGFGFGPEVIGDVAESGSRVVLDAVACFAGTSSCTPAKDVPGVPYEFTRAAGGWAASSLLPAGGVDAGWKSFSADTGVALLTMPTAPGGEEDWYASEGGGPPAHIGPALPPADGPDNPLDLYPTSTPDLSHVVWNASSLRWPFDLTIPGSGARAAYEYVGTGGVAPVLVGVTGGAGSTDLVSICGAEIPRRGLSVDGRVVFFKALPCSTGSGVNAGVAVPVDEVWARIDESRSVRLSARSPSDCSGACASSAEAYAEFKGASADGSRAFFTSAQQLTNGASEDSLPGDDDSNHSSCASTVGVNGCNLYLYDFSRPADQNPIAVSAGDTSGNGPRVRGVVDVSSDGSHVYFVAQGVLSQTANDRGEFARDGANNLYVYERDAAHPEGHTAFIAILPSSDQEEWNNPVANVTPDGRFLVFTSYGRLTADDTSLSGAAQLFRYDALSGQLIRISMGDLGFDDNGNRPVATPCSPGGFCSEDVQIVSPRGGGPYNDPRLDPTMSHDGAYVFFTSPVALTPGGLDDVQVAPGEEGVPRYAQNVYEWHAGRVYLISDGKDTSQHSEYSGVHLIGSDATGANVFFSTADPLVAGDTDTQIDVYDARVCTPSEPCLRSVAPVEAGCVGEACHVPPGPVPGLAGVASSTLTGVGNLLPPAAATGHRKAVVKKHAKPRKHKRARSKGKGKKKGKRGRKAAARHAHGKSGVRS